MSSDRKNWEIVGYEHKVIKICGRHDLGLDDVYLPYGDIEPDRDQVNELEKLLTANYEIVDARSTRDFVIYVLRRPIYL